MSKADKIKPGDVVAVLPSVQGSWRLDRVEFLHVMEVKKIQVICETAPGSRFNYTKHVRKGEIFAIIPEEDKSKKQEIVKDIHDEWIKKRRELMKEYHERMIKESAEPGQTADPIRADDRKDRLDLCCF